MHPGMPSTLAESRSEEGGKPVPRPAQSKRVTTRNPDHGLLKRLECGLPTSILCAHCPDNLLQVPVAGIQSRGRLSTLRAARRPSPEDCCPMPLDPLRRKERTWCMDKGPHRSARYPMRLV